MQNARRFGWAALATVALLAVAACGDDGGGAADGGDVSELCPTWVEVEAVLGQLGDPEAGDDQVVTIAAEVRDLLEGVDDVPGAVAGSVEVALAGVQAAADGDVEAFESPEVDEAATEIGLWVFDECGFEPVEIDYYEYGFEGLPETIPAGFTSFRATATGDEPHVMLVYRVKAGVDGTASEAVEGILAADDPEAALAEGADAVAAGAFAPPGASAALSIDLDAGRYFVICPIPAGASLDGPPPADAAPHFAHGMVGVFTVG